jgi:tetratricopeptide (TPR) repeat protein
MPLAIELAAARVKLLTPDQILARLDHHLALLSAGARDLPERQQTLRGAIAWSYDLLDEGARRLLDRLSVFRGGFELEVAAQTVGSPDELGGDAIDRIGELVDQSLVRPDEDVDTPRFSMLETIREFAAEMLGGRDDAEEIERRHALAFADLAERAAPELSGANQRTWLDRLERDHDNLRAAVEWAADHDPPLAVRLAFALWRFWQQRGYLNEARVRFDAMAARDWALEPRDRARFAEAYGGIAYWQSDETTARRWYDEALTIWRDLGEKSEIANALFNRSYADVIVVMSGEAAPEIVESGRAKLDEALALYREIGDRKGEGNVLWGLGSYHYFTADAATAESWYRQSLDLHRSTGQRTMEAWSLHMLALAAAGQRRFDDAREQATHALRHFYEAGDIAGVTLVIDDLAIVAANEGDLPRAGRLWGAARHLQQTSGTALADYVEQNNALFGIPTPHHLLGEEELATLSAEGAAMGLDELVAYALGVERSTLMSPHRESL